MRMHHISLFSIGWSISIPIVCLIMLSSDCVETPETCALPGINGHKVNLLPLEKRLGASYAVNKHLRGFRRASPIKLPAFQIACPF
jgi:hypothetical protein